MHKHHPDIHDVVIAGGGPVGLFLACELRLLDLSVLVLERSEDPHSPLKRMPFGMRGLSAGTLEALYSRGLLDEVVAAQRANDGADSTAKTAPWMEQPRRPAGHFAGIPFYHDDIVALSPDKPGRHQHGRRIGDARNSPGPPSQRHGGRN